ncbi:hypothetical protein B0H13DRAFT_2319883 [Mycena leptocephala]|nr:hypothetical protein B0H13DRAFT_2319883 [Mycena leptocephala]
MPVNTLTTGKESRSQPEQWRYNMEKQAHPEYASPRNPDAGRRLPHLVWTSMAVGKGEEVAFGIPLSKIPAPFARVAGPNEGVEENVKGCNTVMLLKMCCFLKALVCL